MPRGLYTLEALGLEIHKAALTYMPVTDRGTNAGFDQAAASHHLNIIRYGLKPEHAFEAGNESLKEGTGRAPQYDVIDGTPQIPADGADAPAPGKTAPEPHAPARSTDASTRFATPRDEWMQELTAPPPGLKADPDALNTTLDHAYIYKGAAAGELFDPERLPALEKVLTDHGVKLDPNAREELAKLDMAAAFANGVDKSVSMLIKDGASFREVMHELGHFATFRHMGSVEGYKRASPGLSARLKFTKNGCSISRNLEPTRGG